MTDAETGLTAGCEEDSNAAPGGHASNQDSIEIAGSIPDRDATISYREGDRIEAVATIFRDRASLEAELAMERDDEKELARIVGQ